MLSLVASLVAGTVFASPAHAQFYKGKNLTLLVNYGAGGNAHTVRPEVMRVVKDTIGM